MKCITIKTALITGTLEEGGEGERLVREQAERARREGEGVAEAIQPRDIIF